MNTTPIEPITVTGAIAGQSTTIPVMRSPELTDITTTAEQRDLYTLNAENPDAVGYIKIGDFLKDGVYKKEGDASYYLSHSRTGEHSRKGELFFDFRNDVSGVVAEKNLIIYGHNMRSGEMFGNLDQYLDTAFYEAHRTIILTTMNGTYTYTVYAVYEAPAASDYIKTSFGSDEDFLLWLEKCKKSSMYKCDLTIDISDRVLTLSTCSPLDDTRLVVQSIITGG